MKIRRIVIYTLLMLVSSFGYSNETIELHYRHYIFRVPLNPVLLGTYADTADVLTLIYESVNNDGSYSSDDKKLSIRHIENDELTLDLKKQSDCDIGLFLNDVFNNKKESGCNQEYLDFYHNLYFKVQEFGTWPGKDVAIYYEVKGTEITVTLISDEHIDVMIQTNKMTKEEVKAILANYIAE